jgi:hypothetical protein
MELEDLKSIWKNSEPDFLLIGEAEIALMLKKNSLSIVDKLKRNVWFELLITLAASVGFLIYALQLPSGALKWTTTSIILMCLGYTVYYIKKLVLLSRFNPATENIRTNLTALVQNLTSYLKFYKRSYTVLYPIYFCVGLLFGGLERGAERFFDTLFAATTIMYIVIFAGLFYLLSKKFTNWYLNKLYGNHLNKLKSLLDDLQTQQ